MSRIFLKTQGSLDRMSDNTYLLEYKALNNILRLPAQASGKRPEYGRLHKARSSMLKPRRSSYGYYPTGKTIRALFVSVIHCK